MSSSRQRLDQLLSLCGYCSRREARVWLRAGRVTVDGGAARSPEEKVSPEAVRVDGEPLDAPEGLLVLLNKPAGLVCSHDPAEGLGVYDLFPARWLARNPPVTTAGRLDKDTTGALLVTDHGEWVHRWTSPRRHVEKLYEATLDRDPDPRLVELFASGTLVLAGENSPCEPARLELRGGREIGLTLTEGRYHQVKRMFASQGFEVMRLHRARFGAFTVEGLAPGEWRRLDLSLGLA